VTGVTVPQVVQDVAVVLELEVVFVVPLEPMVG